MMISQDVGQVIEHGTQIEVIDAYKSLRKAEPAEVLVKQVA
jgi:hypothetical protein